MLVEELENATYAGALKILKREPQIMNELTTYPEGSVLVIYIATGDGFTELSGRVIVKRLSAKG